MDDYKFRVVFLEEANKFLSGLNEKERDKILYNIWRACSRTDKDLFRQRQDEIWEFRTMFYKTCFLLFAFWDKTGKTDTVVISNHKLVKETDTISQEEIDRVEKLRKKYFNEKTQMRNENV